MGIEEGKKEKFTKSSYDTKMEPILIITNIDKTYFLKKCNLNFC